MHKKLIGAALAAAAVTAPVSARSVWADGHPAPNPDQTLADILLSDGDQFDHDWQDYDIVTEAVLLFPDLVAAAANPDAELTVFLPNDRAFRSLVKDLTGSRPRSEQATFDAVASLGIDTVAAVLTYHIVVGPPISFEAAKQADGAVLTTLQGATFEVDVKGRWWPRVRLVDNDPDARDPRVVQGDVGGAASNGYAHGINAVLRPIDL